MVFKYRLNVDFYFDIDVNNVDFYGIDKLDTEEKVNLLTNILADQLTGISEITLEDINTGKEIVDLLSCIINDEDTTYEITELEMYDLEDNDG